MANIREAPAPSAAVNFKLEKGDEVRVDGSEGDWYRISVAEKKKGWAHRGLFAQSTAVEPVPLAQAKDPETPKQTSPAEKKNPTEASDSPELYLPDLVKRIREEKHRFSLLADVTAFFSNSRMEGEDDLNGGDVSGVIAPSFDASDSTQLILMYRGQYYKRREFFTDDVGPRERTEFQGHTINPMVRIDFGENKRYSITPSVFYTKTLNKDVQSDSWDGGLYNYDDIGAGVDLRMLGAGFAGGQGALTGTLQYYHREYPNYDSLLDLATGIGVERDEKDYSGILFRAGYDWLQQFGLSWTADYSLLYKMLDDKKVVDENGVLTDTGAREHLHGLDLSTWYAFTSGIRVGLDTSFYLNESNQNWYDALNTISLADDVFIRDYYDYYSYRVRPFVSYTFGLFGLFPFSATYAFSFYELFYTDRLAKFPDGTYKSDEQEDEEEEHFTELRYELNRQWSLIGQFQYIRHRSNNDDEQVYRYHYEVYNTFLGARFTY